MKTIQIKNEMTIKEVQEWYEAESGKDHLCYSTVVGSYNDRYVEWLERRFVRAMEGRNRTAESLLDALRKIANPMEYLTDEAVKSGGKLDGVMAMQLIKDVELYGKLRKKPLINILSVTPTARGQGRS